VIGVGILALVLFVAGSAEARAAAPYTSICADSRAVGRTGVVDIRRRMPRRAGTEPRMISRATGNSRIQKKWLVGGDVAPGRQADDRVEGLVGAGDDGGARRAADQAGQGVQRGHSPLVDHGDPGRTGVAGGQLVQDDDPGVAGVSLAAGELGEPGAGLRGSGTSPNALERASADRLMPRYDPGDSAVRLLERAGRRTCGRRRSGQNSVGSVSGDP
jgi:hypothetical protein